MLQKEKKKREKEKVILESDVIRSRVLRSHRRSLSSSQERVNVRFFCLGAVVNFKAARESFYLSERREIVTPRVFLPARRPEQMNSDDEDEIRAV